MKTIIVDMQTGNGILFLCKIILETSVSCGFYGGAKTSTINMIKELPFLEIDGVPLWIVAPVEWKESLEFIMNFDFDKYSYQKPLPNILRNLCEKRKELKSKMFASVNFS